MTTFSEEKINYACAAAYGPLVDHALRFVAELRAQSYARASVWQYQCCLTQLGRRMAQEEVGLDDLDERQALELMAGAETVRARNTSGVFIVKRFVGWLVEQGLAKPSSAPTPTNVARAELRRDYEAYLRRQRGLSERTIFHCWRFADRFLDFRFGNEMEELGVITADDIARFMLHLTTRRRRPFRDRTPPTHLRNFFRYLFKAGKTPVDLAAGVPNIRLAYGARLPRYLMAEQVELLLEAVRTGSSDKVRRRNYAMVLLLARLGLRASEGIAIQIGDIDWRAGEIVVRGKGQRHDRLPLPPDVGAALADYLRFERGPSASRMLFVTAKAPYRPFHDSQMLNAVLKAAFIRAGVKPPAPYVGSHVLRHSLASQMARQGASLEEIGDVLRHRSRASTMIYAKLDIDGLRSVAQPWPVAGGAE